jgi:hypothetical protein
VLAYLEAYAQHFHLSQFVQFNTKVKKKKKTVLGPQKGFTEDTVVILQEFCRVFFPLVGSLVIVNRSSKIFQILVCLKNYEFQSYHFS